MSLRLVLAAFVAGLALVGPAHAFQDADMLDYEVRLPLSQTSPIYSHPTELEAQGMLPGLARFQAGEGADWKVLQWNPLLETPSTIGGPPIALMSAGASDEIVRASVESFVARNAELLRVDPRDLIVSDMVDLGEEKQYVIFNQVVDGIEVVGGRVDVGIWKGNVVLLGSDFHRGVDVRPVPGITVETATEIAHTGIPSSSEDSLIETPRLVILPVAGDAGFEYHLAWQLHLRTHDPENVWLCYVDAHRGELLMRESQTHYLQITGTVQGKVEPNTQGDPYEDLPLEDLRLRASSTYTGYTNDNGDYVIEVPNQTTYSVEAKLYGSFCNTLNYDGAEAVITQNGTPGTPLDFMFDDTNSHPAERDTYYHVQVVHDWVKGVDPAFTGMDYVMAATVNITTGTCNAYWNGSSINFYKEGGGCNNIGRISDVIYHEYGHGITQKMYSPNQPPTSSGMGEAFSDIASMTIHNDGIVGENFQVGGGFVRTGENLRQYPASECGGQVHCLGEVLMGSMWKARKNFNTKYGNAGAAPIYDADHIAALKTKQTSMPNYLTRLLLANDTDGNLANGTPDYYEICDAFAIHNLPCPPITNYVVVTSTPIDDQPQDVGGYAITAVATSVGAGSIDPNGVEIYYTIDPVGTLATTWQTAAMTPTGNPNEFAGEIPNQGCGKHVRYYVRAQKLTGEFATAPHLAPYRNVYEFMTGATDIALNDDLETNQGWTIGWTGDTATQGIWERANPTGKWNDTYGYTQPEDDHSATGTLCFVTDARGGAWSSYDVDGGVTSVVSPAFDWSDRSGVAAISFHAFYFDYTPTDDTLRCAISNDDGATWTDIRTVNGTELNAWNAHKVYVENERIPFTGQMRFRFQMEDINTFTTCAEAAIDDIVIKVNDCFTADVADGALPLRFDVEQNRPNPFNPLTAIRFALPKGERVEVSIFDAAGRKVRTLLDAGKQAGTHTVVWDGRDDSDHSVGSGVYYYTVKAGEQESSRKMMLLK